jgi:hypothetical protein
VRPLERRVEVQHVGDGTYRVAVFVVVNSTPMLERKREGISTRERAEEVASEYRQQLGIEGFMKTSDFSSMKSPQPRLQMTTLEQFEMLVMKQMPSFKAMVKREHCDDTKPIEDWAKMFGWWLERDEHDNTRRIRPHSSAPAEEVPFMRRSWCY